MTPEEKEAQARVRFFALSLLRLAGAVMVMMGIVISSGRFAGVPIAVGYVLVVIGFADLAMGPRLLARRWRTPPEA